MADKSDPYVFRVINGRVVPIKVSGEQRELRQDLQYARKKQRYHEGKKTARRRYAEAGATVAGGIAIIAGSQFGAGRFAKYAAKRLQPTRKRISELVAKKPASIEHAQAIKKLKRKVMHQAKITKQFRNYLAVTGVATGAGLTAKGFEKAVETYRQKPLSDREKIAAIVGLSATAVGTGAFAYGYRTGRGRKISAFFKKIKLGI